MTMTESTGHVEVSAPDESSIVTGVQFTPTFKGKPVGLTFVSKQHAEQYVSQGVAAGNDRADYGEILVREYVNVTTPWEVSA